MILARKFNFKKNLPRAISRSDSARANLAVNLSSVFSVLSRAEGDAPSKAARIAKISSASEDDECLDGPLERRGDTISLPGDSIPSKKISLGQNSQKFFKENYFAPASQRAIRRDLT